MSLLEWFSLEGLEHEIARANAAVMRQTHARAWARVVAYHGMGEQKPQPTAADRAARAEAYVVARLDERRAEVLDLKGKAHERQTRFGGMGAMPSCWDVW